MLNRNIDDASNGSNNGMNDFARYMYELPEGDPITLTVASALLAGKITVDEAIMLDSSQDTLPDIIDL